MLNFACAILDLNPKAHSILNLIVTYICTYNLSLVYNKNLYAYKSVNTLVLYGTAVLLSLADSASNSRSQKSTTRKVWKNCEYALR